MRFVTIVRRWLGPILLAGAVAAGVAFVASMVLPKQYASESKVLVGSLTQTNPDQLVGYQQLAQTYAEVATTTPVLAKVIEKLGLAEDPQELSLAVSVRAPAGQAIIEIVAQGSSAQQAAAIADALAAEITEIAKPAGVDQQSLASILQPALLPDGPSSPRVLLNTLIAGLLGLCAGLAIALIQSSRSRTLVSAT